MAFERRTRRQRLQLSTMAIALTLVCVGLGALAVERYLDGAMSPLWVLPRVVGCSVIGAGVGFAAAEFFGGPRATLWGLAAGFIVGWNAAVLWATAAVVWELP